MEQNVWVCVTPVATERFDQFERNFASGYFGAGRDRQWAKSLEPFQDGGHIKYLKINKS